MYGIHFYDRVPAPKPATGEKIVAAHYFGAWAKSQKDPHNIGFHDLNDFPERTPLQGYYDNDDPQEMDWEIKWALEHGINAFVYCWYRKKENLNHPVTLDDLSFWECIHKGLFGSRYCDRIKFAIMMEAQNSNAATNATDMVENLMPFWLDEYFTRGNYLLIDNKPVLFVYDYNRQFANGFADADQQRRTFDACREMARQRGFDGMLFGVEYRFEDLSAEADYRARGYDFIFPYCWDWKKPQPEQDYIVQRQLQLIDARFARDPACYVATASCMWDPTPWFRTAPAHYNDQAFPSLWKLKPENFRTLLRGIRQRMDALPPDSLGARMLMLDNWNEWAEGHYILPSMEFGFGYLQAVREELTARDNLPDYRMPQQLGAPPLNSYWAEPDFSAYPPISPE